MKAAVLIQRILDRGVEITPEKTERGVSVTRTVRTTEIDVQVKRKTGGTIVERHVVESPWYSVFANGELVDYFAEDADVDPGIEEEVVRLSAPLPHEAMDPRCKTSFTAIGLVGMQDSENAMQLAKVEIADGKMVSIEPLFMCERERDSFAFTRLETTLVGLVASSYDNGDFHGPSEVTDA